MYFYVAFWNTCLKNLEKALSYCLGQRKNTCYGILIRNWEGGNDLQADYPLVSYADLYQMASAVSIEHAGGPKINMKYGRKDHHHAAWRGLTAEASKSNRFWPLFSF